jgi:hypothetical protein
MKRNLIITIVFLLASSLLAGCGGSQYQKQLDLGYKFLQEEKYEEAIIAMNKAIDIDDKRPEAYIGLGDVFVTRCDENTVSDASDALKRGYEKSKSDLIAKAFLDLADKLVDKGKTDWAVQFLEFGYKLTNDEKLKTKREELSKANHSETLNQLAELCKGKEYKKIAEIMNGDSFKSEMADVTSEKPVLQITNAQSGADSEVGVGIYAGKGGLYIYYGELENNRRTGTGIWVANFGDQYCVYEGKWKNDAPSGSGTTKKETVYTLDDNNSIDYLEVHSGNVKNGLWDGSVEALWESDVEGIPSGFVYNLNDGIVEVIENEDREDGFYYTVGKGIREEDGVFSMDDEQIKLKYGVPGFADSVL